MTRLDSPTLFDECLKANRKNKTKHTHTTCLTLSLGNIVKTSMEVSKFVNYIKWWHVEFETEFSISFNSPTVMISLTPIMDIHI